MKATHQRVLASAAAAVFSLLALGDSSAAQRRPIIAPQGVPQDWSHRSVVYKPDTPQEAARKGRTAQWQRNYQDPRFVVALTRKLQVQAEAQDMAVRASAQSKKKKKKPPVDSGIHRDWSEVMGGGTNGLGGVGVAGVYPAKYSFSLTAAPDCTNDFVVYPTGAAGSTAVFGNVEGLNSAFSAGTPSGTITIGAAGTARSVVLTAGGSNSGLTFQVTASKATNATNLIDAVNRWSATTGITAQQLPITNSGGVRFLRNTPSNTTTISVTANLGGTYALGSVVGGSGTAGQPTVVAFNQLYSSCGSVTPPDPYYPAVRWSYNTSLTGENDVAETSPVISYFDGGKQIAFVQRNPAPSPDTLELVLLKPGTATGTTGSPAAPPLAATAADYRNNTGACSTAAGCMFVIGFSGTSDTNGAVTFSAPYVDYYGDTLWVGDGNSHLHKFTGVFYGAPAEVTTGGFPAAVSATAGLKLSPPVFDGGTDMVFVGSSSPNIAGVGGMLHRVDAGNGTVVSSAKLTADNGTGVRASPLLDSSAARVYAFLFDDGGTGCGGVACQNVVQFPTNFTAAATGTKALVGRGNASGVAMYNGTFDDAYYSSATPDGNLYVCGTATNDVFDVVMWKVPIVNNVMQAPVQGAEIGNPVNDTCSPISEVKNNGNDYLYVGVTDNGVAAGCTGSCLYMLNLNDLNGTAGGTGAAWGSTNATSAGLTSFGGTGGVVIDNVSSVSGASQVYFSNLTSPGNAYQASQAGLQ